MYVPIQEQRFVSLSLSFYILYALACAGVNLKDKSATHAGYSSFMCVLQLNRPQDNLCIFLESPILWVPSTTHKTCSSLAWEYLACVYSHSIVVCYFNLWRTDWLNIDFFCGLNLLVITYRIRIIITFVIRNFQTILHLRLS